MNHHSIHGGYSLLTATQLSKVLAALINKQISFYAFRTFFACVEGRESRKAFYISQPKQAVRGRYAHYTTGEISQMMGARSTRLIPGALRSLKRHNLLSLTEKSIHISSDPSETAQALLEVCHLGRTPRRKIPVPRRMVRFLARCAQASVAKTLVFYLLRALSLKRGGLIHAKGTMKSSLLAQVSRLSLRAVRAARRELISLGLISPDCTHSQRKLNRTGVFFSINLQWTFKSKSSAERKKACSNPAPPSPSKRSDPSPPIKRIRTSNEGRNQNLCDRTNASGVSKTSKPKTSKHGAPSLSHVIPDDLGNVSRLQQLYRQAVEHNWVQRSESNWLAWVAAAVRARRHGKQDQGVKLFMAIIRQQLYQHITHEEEDEARRLIRTHRHCTTTGITTLVHQVLTDLSQGASVEHSRGTLKK